MLVTPDCGKAFKLYMDTSGDGIGRVLMQELGDIDHPIGYYSKKFLSYQRNYSTLEKEALAVIMCLNPFDIYVRGTMLPVRIFTDHNPLVFLSKIKISNQRLMR